MLIFVWDRFSGKINDEAIQFSTEIDFYRELIFKLFVIERKLNWEISENRAQKSPNYSICPFPYLLFHNNFSQLNRASDTCGD